LPISPSPTADTGAEIARLRTAYLDLMRDSLIGRLNADPEVPVQPQAETHAASTAPYEDKRRELGWDWPSQAPSMIGYWRMQNLRSECERVLNEGVPGDFMETGVWRGGAAMMMRAVLKAHGVAERRVIAADSFAGFPVPAVESVDATFQHAANPFFAVPLEEVKAGFQRYGLLDDQVIFLEGFFKDTLPTAPVAALALLRLDGDMYESTRDGLTYLYDKLSPRGTLIVDDYFLFDQQRQAVDEFRAARGIADPIVQVDYFGGYWIKSAQT
jgi:O-methyltransferase/8-demethyl-8-(2,3-dimethoxy-alpha-L-rhamnosyl)tetracenomycin-C 4'-O-methyltransferase